MEKEILNTAEKVFRSKYVELTDLEKHVAQHITERTPISADIIQELSAKLTMRQKMADKVAAFGGARVFISIFMAVMVVWIVLNSVILIGLNSEFDPYP